MSGRHQLTVQTVSSVIEPFAEMKCELALRAARLRRLVQRRTKKWPTTVSPPLLVEGRPDEEGASSRRCTTAD